MLLTLGGLLAGVAVAALAWMYARKMRGDEMQRLGDHRRGSCRMVGRGELVDGKQHIPVSLALSASTLYYENRDLEASLDLSNVEEVEYANELVTGQPVGAGKVMRLRCFSKVFEFVIDRAALSQWQAVLPAVRVIG